MNRHRYVDEQIRRKWHDPTIVLKDVGLRDGMVFMDIGCGDGFFAIPAAKIVGEKGKVFAVDIDPFAIERLKHKTSEEKINNLAAIVGNGEETIFCHKCSDIVFYGIVLHDFKTPAKVLQNARQMLKPEGRLVNFDWKKEPMDIGPPLRIRFAKEQASALIKQAGFRIDKRKDYGHFFYVITAKPQRNSGASSKKKP